MRGRKGRRPGPAKRDSSESSRKTPLSSREARVLGRPPVPRRALVAAALGALYGILILPAPETVLGITLTGVAWFVLSLSLLFVLPLAYHAYTFWAILWVVYRGIAHFRAGDGNLLLLALDVAMPIASLALLMTSGYLQAAAPPAE